jgi:hypothetical protein
VRRAARVAAAVLAVAAAAACSEDIDGGAACPALCPDEALATRDTVLEPLVLDTTLSGYPGTGLEGVLPLSSRGDTLDVRAVVRFDALPSTFTPTGGAATPYTQLTSAVLTAAVDSLGTAVVGPVTVEAYDVAGADTARAGLAPLFTPARLVGSVSYATRTELGDTLRIPVDPAVVLPRLQASGSLRLGLRLRSAGSAQINLPSFEGTGGAGARLRLRTAADTAAQQVTPASVATAPASAAAELRDFAFVERGPALPPPTRLAAGGVFGRRVLLQFSVPPSILDSATVVRASLELTQAPNRGAPAAAVPVVVFAQPVTAGQALSDTLPNGALTDPARVANFLCRRVLAPTGAASPFCPPSGDVAYRLDSVVVAPRDSGTRRLEVGELVRFWRAPTTLAAERSLVLRAPIGFSSSFESQQGGDVLFFSKEAPPAVRPRLRLTYVTRSSYALP